MFGGWGCLGGGGREVTIGGGGGWGQASLHSKLSSPLLALEKHELKPQNRGLARSDHYRNLRKLVSAQNAQSAKDGKLSIKAAERKELFPPE